jgi:hypothetical protein
VARAAAATADPDVARASADVADPADPVDPAEPGDRIADRAAQAVVAPGAAGSVADPAEGSLAHRTAARAANRMELAEPTDRGPAAPTDRDPAVPRAAGSGSAAAPIARIARIDPEADRRAAAGSSARARPAAQAGLAAAVGRGHRSAAFGPKDRAGSTIAGRSGSSGRPKSHVHGTAGHPTPR